MFKGRVIRGLPSDMFLELNVGPMKWAEPDPPLKGTGNYRRRWAGIRPECSFKEVPFAAILGRDVVFQRGKGCLERHMGARVARTW